MRFRSLAALGVVLTIVGAAACTDNSGPNGSVGGLYALASVNGASLPYTYSVSNGSGGTSTITLQSDVYTLNGNGSYSEVINETVNNGFTSSPTTDNETGTWSQNGTVVNFYPTNSTFNTTLAPYSATISSSGTFGSNVLVFDTGSEQLVYQHE